MSGMRSRLAPCLAFLLLAPVARADLHSVVEEVFHEARDCADVALGIFKHGFPDAADVLSCGPLCPPERRPCCDWPDASCVLDVIPHQGWGQLSGEYPFAYCLGPRSSPQGGLVPELVADVGKSCTSAPTEG